MAILNASWRRVANSLRFLPLRLFHIFDLVIAKRLFAHLNRSSFNNSIDYCCCYCIVVAVTKRLYFSNVIIMMRATKSLSDRHHHHHHYRSTTPHFSCWKNKFLLVKSSSYNTIATLNRRKNIIKS